MNRKGREKVIVIKSTGIMAIDVGLLFWAQPVKQFPSSTPEILVMETRYIEDQFFPVIQNSEEL